MARTDVEALVLQMSADMRKMEKGVNQARGMVARQTKLIEDRFDQMNAHIKKSGSNVMKDLQGALAGIGLGLAIRQVVEYADAWTSARNKLAAAGVAAGDVARVQSDLVDLSIQTRTSLSATVDLYTRITRATENYGISAGRVYRATEILNKAFKASGATVQEQQAAILQLGQALQSGVLQGDELRSIRENAPLLAQAIADEFGVTIGQLKELGAQGRLTTDRIFSGIINAGAEIDSQFATTSATVSDAFTNIGSAATRFIGTLDQAIGSSSFFQEVMKNVEAAINAASGALDSFVDNRPGQELSGLALRIQSALNSTIDAVGDYRSETALASTATKQLTKEQLALYRESQKTGVAQRDEAIFRLQLLKDELAAYKKRAEARKADLNRRHDDPLNFDIDATVKYLENLAFVNSELENIEIFDKALSKQISAATFTNPANFLPPDIEKVVDIAKVLEGANWTRYTTDLEKLLDITRQLEGAQTDLATALVQAETAATNAVANDNGSPEALATIKRTAEALSELQEKANGANLSRAGVAAILEYARATNDIASAFRRIDDLKSILTPDDLALVSRELTNLATQSVAAVSTGFTKLENDYVASLAEIEKARQNALAAGVEDMRWYYEALDKIERDYRDDRMKMFDEKFPTSNVMSVSEAIDSAIMYNAPIEKIIEDLHDEWVRQGLVPSEAMLALRDQMRDSVKQAMREGIRTGDWGDSFAMILADAVTAALDESLDRLGDLLADLFFGQNNNDGILSGIANAAMAVFGGGRASGGAVMGGRAYKVNENEGEFLYMPKGQNGQVLNTAQLQRMLGAGGGGMVSISAPFIVNGSIDAVTWPKIQAHLQERDARLIRSMPAAVNGTLMDNRHQKRRI